MSSEDYSKRIKAVADALIEINGSDEVAALPSPDDLKQIVKNIQYLLFPSHCQDMHDIDVGGLLVDVHRRLAEQIERAFKSADNHSASNTSSEEIAAQVIDELPKIREVLESDLEAVQNRDPAAKNRSEIILAYPGFEALMVYRIAHVLYQKKVPLVPRIISENVHRDTGIDIHPAANISPYCSIDHGTGLIIGETTVIGKNVSLYHNVTLGSRSVSPEFRNKKRHPTIGDDVIIYPGATILGDIEIGSGSTIGGNTFLLESCPPNTKIVSKPPEMVIKSNSN